MRDRRDAWHALRQEADRSEDSDHHRRHELWRPVGPCQGGARPRRLDHGHLHHHRRRRHDRGRAAELQNLGLSDAALALRHEPRSFAQGRRHRNRRRPGRQARGGGMLLGQKISKRVAEMRTLPEGIDQRSACRHPDWTGPDDLEIKIEEIREITDWEKPIFIKIGAARPYYDTALAVKAGADVVVLDGMQGGTAATQDVFIEHCGIPTLAAIRPAVRALQELDMHRKVQLIVSGGIRSGADVAKALALGADAVSIGTAALIALGDNDPNLEDEYRKLGTTAGAYDDWHEGRDPAGITTQDPVLAARLDPVLAGKRLANYLSVLTLECQTIARANGKSHVHNLEPEDLVALTVEAAAMAQVPLAGTDWIPGRVGF